MVLARTIEVVPRPTLDDYMAVAHLAPLVRELQAEAQPIARALAGRTLWMVNSTEQGGGVAEMLPTMVALLRELGISTEWVVIEAEEPAFFRITKQLHNLIHGSGEADLGASERDVYEAVNRRNAAELRPLLHAGDILAVHDPQPMPLAGMLRDADLTCIWRCHIGLDDETPETRTAWEFLAPYAAAYDQAIFSAPEYIPRFFRHRSRVLYPAIDPLTDKNRELPLHKLVGVLANAALVRDTGPVLTPPYDHLARRLAPSGVFEAANGHDEIGVLSRPIVTQISRWDRLKGYLPLLRAFALLKERARARGGDGVQARRLHLTRLVLAGPDPDAVADDPEGVVVIEELRRAYLDLPAELQRDVAILALPMVDRRQNALMVNALQRASSIVVQNSLREGFGLTIAEAMWKRVPVLSNTRACGPRQQVRDRIDGRMVRDPTAPETLASALNEMLAASGLRETWGRSGQRRVHDQFLIFTQLRGWLQLLNECAIARC